MAGSWENCLRCDKLFLGNAKNCPECRDELKAQKQADKKALAEQKAKNKKAKLPKSITRNCQWCGKEYEATKWGGTWTSHCPDCNERKPWFRVYFKNTTFHRS